MLNTQKLLYILPDVAYITELLPAKKEHTFVVQAFRQINGDFLNEDELIAENIEKLFSKIEPEEYQIILPDFLFTNTILEVGETGENKVKSHVKDKVLPSLDLNNDRYQVDIFSLTERQGKTKVQLSAIENSVLNPIALAAEARNIKIKGVTSLSWSIKSVVSLEPSITVIQIGSYLYLAQHYIGIDQANQAKVEDLDTLAETVKTLKGAEPSLQTVYLLTNELVAENFKQQISSTLPVQQLATFKEDETQMPSYVKQTIEAGMKTLDIPEYHAPSFDLPKAVPADSIPAVVKSEVDEEHEATPVVKPAEIHTLDTGSDDDADDNDGDSDDEDNDLEEVSPPTKTVSSIVTSQVDLDDIPKPSMPIEEVTMAVTVATPAVPATIISADFSADIETLDDKALAQFGPHSDETPTLDKPIIESTIKVDTSETKPVVKTEHITMSIPSDSINEEKAVLTSVSESRPTLQNKAVIKNKSGASSFFKMVGLTFLVFALTVAVGVGLGLGFLKFTSGGFGKTAQASPTPSPTIQPSPTTQPSPTPDASASAQIDKAKTNILIVNATSIAGYAGKTKKSLEDAGYKNVSASNAKGEYEDGTYVLMKTKNEALIAELAKITKLKLEFDPGITTEDPKNQYQAVIVLAE